MKIVYFIESLAYKGGAERIVTEKMNYLAEVAGYDVTVVTYFQYPQESNTYPLSDKVRQTNLAIEKYRQYQYGYPRRLWERWKYHRLLVQRMNETVARLQPDIVVGMGYSQADVVCRIKTTAPKVIESHEARPYTLTGVFHDVISPVLRVYYSLYKHQYLHTIERHADVVVTLTKGDAKEWRKARRVVTIPNFLTVTADRLSDGASKRIMAVGRLTWQKGYDRLLDSWRLVAQRYPDWHLDIFGEGPLEHELQQTIRQQALHSVTIHPFTSHIGEEYANSAVFVLTSRFEGFSLVLIEAMQHGIPCVSFDCPYGPGDLIDDGRNGYLVKDGDTRQLADKLCYLIAHSDVRASFGQEAIKKSQAYDKQAIMKQWTTLFESLV
jgi:glycosyltransferase involved in cell wall biosynthesis